MLEIIVLGLTALFNLLLGLIVYLKNPEGATNRLFMMLTSVFVAWSVVNYISVHPYFLSHLVWIRLVLFFGALLNLSLLLTFFAFPSVNYPNKYLKRTKYAVISTIFIMALTLTPLVFKSLKVTTGHSTAPNPGPGIVLFLLQTVILVGTSIFTLVTKFKTSHGVVKNQLRIVLFAVAATFSLILITNFLFVVVFHNTFFVPFGPSFTLVFSSAFAYAIIKHRLFDIRQVAARGLGYILTIVFLAGAYSALIFGISNLLLNLNHDTSDMQIFDVILAILFGLSFQTFKGFFDRISDRLFFKDAYDPQAFLDELNQILVKEVELQQILKETLQLITKLLKTNSSAFVIRKTAYAPVRLIGTANNRFSEENLRDLLMTLNRHQQKVLVADYMEGEEQRLGDRLKSLDIAVVIRLAPNINTPTSDVGELILSAKRNGDPYFRKDIQLLEIIANELVIAIENALRFEEIQNFNLTLQAKVDDATRQLRHANERLKVLDETKDDFISMASHQLRTPLTSVKGYLSMVLEGDAGKLTKMEKEMLGQAFFSSQRMVYLIADLLNVSRLKTGKFIIEPNVVNLASLVQEELSQLKETAAAKKLTLAYVQPKNFPDVMLDETKTRQVIMNFVDNAIYYTPAGGHIEVKLINNPSTIELKVVDNGIGVTRSEQPHLFMKFYRAGNARKARPDGTGLGLFMAKKVILAEGGSIVFESEEGKGSTFGFMFSKSKIAVRGDSS